MMRFLLHLVIVCSNNYCAAAAAIISKSEPSSLRQDTSTRGTSITGLYKYSVPSKDYDHEDTFGYGSDRHLIAPASASLVLQAATVESIPETAHLGRKVVEDEGSKGLYELRTVGCIFVTDLVILLIVSY